MEERNGILDAESFVSLSDVFFIGTTLFIMLDLIHIRLLTYRVLTLTPMRWNLKNMQDSFWRFYVHDQDGATIEPNNHDSLAIEENRLYFIPAGVRFDAHTSHNLREFFVHFDVIGLPRIAQREIFDAPICLPDHPVLNRNAQQLQAEILAQETVDMVLQMRCKALLYEGLALYLQKLPSAQIHRSLQLARELEPVLPAIDYIEKHISEPLLNSDLARLCHMHVDYFTRRFRGCVAQTPAQYIQEQRIKLAAQQLVFSDHTIEQISASTGFGNRFYFSRVFVRHMGITPAAYRASTRDH